MEGKMQKLANNLITSILFIIGVCTASEAAIINAASCSQDDVNAAIAVASNGDTVTVPAGNCTWTTEISNTTSVTISQGITLQGAGIDVTTITDGCAHNLVNGGGREFPLAVSPPSGQIVRITGFTFNGSSNDNWQEFMSIGSNLQLAFRVDHIKWNGYRLMASIYAAFGVFDHNTIYTGFNANSFEIYGNGTVGGSCSGACL